MGYLMRRNILVYKAPERNEGYDLICIHPDARHRPAKGKLALVRVQVKSRCATDCDRGFPVHQKSLDAFDYVVVVFLNIGRFSGKNDGECGQEDVAFYTLPNDYIQQHHDPSSSWQKVRLRLPEIEDFKNEKGFERIAQDLGIVKPRKKRSV